MTTGLRHSRNLPPRLLPVAMVWVIVVQTACSNSTSVPEAIAVRPAYVAQVRESNAHRLEFVGDVRATQRAELAFPVTGRVRRVLVEAGDAVSKGQVLAVLDEQPLQEQLAAASGETARAEAQVAESRQRLNRLQAAIQANAVSATESGAAELELTSAESALRTARANRATAAWSLEQAQLRSPMDGIIGLRNLEVGHTVGPGNAVLAVDGAGRELQLAVPEQLPVKAGQTVILHSDGQELTSRILRVAARLDAGGTRKIHVAAPERASVGSTWSAAILNDTTGALEVPLRAVTPSATAGSGSVLRLAGDGRTTESISIKLGASRGEWIEILDGLKASDRVVVAGASAIVPGSQIKPVNVDH